MYVIHHSMIYFQIKVRVTAVKTDKIVASLKLDLSVSISDQIGKTFKGLVVKVENDGLRVFISKLNTEGFVPVQHLSIDLSLCASMLSKCKYFD